jgi:UDP-3-O-[3-hydroxymyristoyl] glucosamine N-acyltransferase
MHYEISEIKKRFKLESVGETSLTVSGVCGLSDNLFEHLAFIKEKKYCEEASQSNIPAFIVNNDSIVSGKTNLIARDPEYVISKIAGLFAPSQLSQTVIIASNASIDKSAKIEDCVTIGANVVIGKNVCIGRGSKVFPNSVIMDRCTIGENCIIYPNCTLREDTILGNECILQPGVSLGGDGFGYLTRDQSHLKIPQLGRVVLEDKVEVGANSTIDRARFSETRIGEGTKIDNLVMMAHNVTTGKDCLIVSQVGVSGSTSLGNRVTLAGQVGTVGHVSVTDDVTVLGKGGITKSINKAGTYAGMPIKPVKVWLKAVAKLYKGLK